MWFVSMIAETHRASLDCVEGESKLLSSFNTVYVAVGFALLFMTEYHNILFIGFSVGVICHYIMIYNDILLYTREFI